MFVRDVFPLFQQKCFSCHGDDPQSIMGGFNMSSREGLLKGGVSGLPALAPGSPEKSRIYVAASWQDADLQMPPREKNRLNTEQIELIHKWIALGAPWADTTTPPKEDAWVQASLDSGDGVIVPTSGGLSQAWSQRRYQAEDLWAFQSVKRCPIPWDDPKDGDKGNPIDAVIDRKLKQAGIQPAGPAHRRIWIRRASFDLIGLPPTPQEIRRFVEDESPEAYEKVINRLLASPHYGEQWGRHWLDVVRYADTSGFANDYERPNAWRYRDYVIRSFNEDKPFNRFIIEQVAGDELDPANPELLIAVGFLRAGPWEHTAMSVAAETRQFFLDDVTNSVGESFLATPLRCARCHDHKFDPIPTRDYYRMQAVFASAQFAAADAPFLPRENQAGFAEGKQRVQRLLKEARDALAIIQAKEDAAARVWFEESGLSYRPKKERRKLPEDQRPPRYVGLTYQDLGVRKALQKRIQRLSRQMDRYRPLAFSVDNRPATKPAKAGARQAKPRVDKVPQTHILMGGSVYAPGESVTPGVLSALPGSHDQKAPAAFNTIPISRDGRRLALANWLANPNNPLTTRVTVNRIWQYHFGRGLAGNPNNFGKTGTKPTHPELLDWLTQTFIERGWSIKSLHRLIMGSQVYRRAGYEPEMRKAKEKNPANQLLAYFNPRRMSAEELRDSMLAVSGELNPEMGGLPIKPEINMEVALQPRHIMGSVAEAYQPSRTPAERNRRTIYAYRLRGLADPMLEVFNQPNADASCERRMASTVTPQVFSLFNSQNSHDRALALAHRLMQERDNLSQRIQWAYQLAYGRGPTTDEITQASTFFDSTVTYHHQHPPKQQSPPTQVKRHMFEEMTGEAFEYIERLDVYEDYVADLKPWDVGPQTRALADLCLVLMNANEFVYIY